MCTVLSPSELDLVEQEDVCEKQMALKQWRAYSNQQVIMI